MDDALVWGKLGKGCEIEMEGVREDESIIEMLPHLKQDEDK